MFLGGYRSPGVLCLQLICHCQRLVHSRHHHRRPHPPQREQLQLALLPPLHELAARAVHAPFSDHASAMNIRESCSLRLNRRCKSDRDSLRSKSGQNGRGKLSLRKISKRGQESECKKPIEYYRCKPSNRTKVGVLVAKRGWGSS